MGDGYPLMSRLYFFMLTVLTFLELYYHRNTKLIFYCTVIQSSNEITKYFNIKAKTPYSNYNIISYYVIVDQTTFKSDVGYLIYLSRCERHDISFAEIVAYCDIDFAGDPKNHPIFWQIKKQSVVVTSTAEVKYTN
ncbi:hypothetical protein PIROE2DRAFT_16330 [Piromyces sp. E2]|nr:hypothetical protein PIROE2DRAFT_16330 [Piromyces sp. E2]|eukprot:OUM58401.1 hypothetical protein PIROE2DRAFT_16330 [Piromyces sp. E2]